VFIVNNSNTNCTIATLGNGTWGFNYKLLSGAKTRR
jgi:hypothetical protein